MALGAFVKSTMNILADLIVLLHFFFVLFVVIGGFLVLKWEWMVWVHLPAVVWGALIEFTGWICPLTPLENWLRKVGGERGYRTSFIEQYVVPILYPTALTRESQMWLGILVILLNAGIYGWVYRRSDRFS